MFTYSNFEDDYYMARVRRQEKPKNDSFQVIVNGEQVPVYTCRISAYPFNREWPGHQRPVDQTEYASYVNLVSDEKLEVEVITKIDEEKVMVKPYSAGVKPERDGNKIKFSLEKNGSYVLQVGSYHNTLYIFNNEPIAKPDKNDVTYFFDAGVHFPGKITLKDNESIYVDKDALVYGCVFGENAKNIKVFGNGIFDNGNEERVAPHCYDSYANGNIKFYDCENISIEGVGFTNSSIWCVNLFHCKNVVMDKIKVFGQWRYNTDGVDIVNSSDIILKNSFIHSFDDTVTIKGIQRYEQTSNRNIITENCVLWCDWGKTCEIGLETMCEVYDNIVFRNCDILRGGNTALDIQNGNYGEVKNILFEDIRIDYESSYTRYQLQENDEMKYSRQNEIEYAKVLNIVNFQWQGAGWGNMSPPIEGKGPMAANVHDILAKNITVYYDKDLPLTDGKFNVPIFIKSYVEGVEYSNVTIENLVVNGVKIDKNSAVLDIQDVKNFKII